MKTITLIAAAGAATALAAGTASAQLTLAFDLNGFNYQFRDAGGAASFGGADHTGSVDWTFRADPATEIAETRMGDEGRFGILEPVELGATLTGLTGNVEFSGGNVTSGNLMITLSTGDTYSTQIERGSIQALTIGGFTLDGLTFDGAFSDSEFGDIDVSEFPSSGLPGSLFKFRFDPDASAGGAADMEVFVMVPLPASAYVGMATLAGVMGLSYLRRRR